jgi:hypothetical protein
VPGRFSNPGRAIRLPTNAPHEPEYRRSLPSHPSMAGHTAGRPSSMTKSRWCFQAVAFQLLLLVWFINLIRNARTTNVGITTGTTSRRITPEATDSSFTPLSAPPLSSDSLPKPSDYDDDRSVRGYPDASVPVPSQGVLGLEQESRLAVVFSPPSIEDFWLIHNASAAANASFPSRTQRVRFYAGPDWYFPPCHDGTLMTELTSSSTDANSGSSEQIRVRRQLNAKPDSGNITGPRWTWTFVFPDAAPASPRNLDRINVTLLAPQRFDVDIVVDQVLLLQAKFASRESIKNRTDVWHACQENHPRYSLQAYCGDILQSRLYSLSREIKEEGYPDTLPVLFQVGDNLEGNAVDWEVLRRQGSADPALLQLYLPRFQKARRFFVEDGNFIETGISNSPRVVSDGSGNYCRRNSVPHVDARDAALSSPSKFLRPPPPILWKLEIDRHYGFLPRVDREDVPWEKKLDAAVFRGTLTGLTLSSRQDANSDVESEQSTVMRTCDDLSRCRFVKQHNMDQRPTQFLGSDSHTEENDSRLPLVDAKLTNTFGRISENHVVEMRLLAERRMKVKEILRFKGIVVLPGNDVASALKWVLYSNSVVIMPPPPPSVGRNDNANSSDANWPPIAISWAMEQLLQPWIHYIPIPVPGYNVVDRRNKRQDQVEEDDWYFRSIVEHRVRWMIDHPKESQAIAARGREWITRLMDPDEERAVQIELLSRYFHHFQFASLATAESSKE